ncbi:very short patch repair endonuclease [Pseudoflavonifractor sp. MSJ-37]|uniref:very short patch repair endonuclease n=1 Tax=Pseudoflavonifractor sp. MSJ-37 TaxID=2841531 RepID=UPI001C109534|nr:very short patch repair endonuclease [Pseudoflavonifractor sp. MSJ-37]MBU5436070.1 very short patch repair endonuclease [Pseudoflavonifractor sp. MSJ-37]
MKHPEFHTTPEISRRMSRVHLKRGKAETMLAKALWHAGFRYRLNDKRLPGSPDIVLGRYRIAVFVDGEFWHGFDWERRKERLKSNRAYWLEKIQENIDRDRRNDQLLREKEWLPLHFWEKEVLKDLEGCVQTVTDAALEQETAAREGAAAAEEL